MVSRVNFGCLVRLFSWAAYPLLQGAEELLYNYRQQTGHCIFYADIGNNIDLDISLAHPWSSDIFPLSAGVSGAAAERRADRNKEKYRKQQLPGGIIATVSLLVMEHFGAWVINGWKLWASYQRSHQTKWDNQTLRSLSTSRSNTFLFSFRSVMLESSLRSYLCCLKETDVTDLFATQYFSH